MWRKAGQHYGASDGLEWTIDVIKQSPADVLDRFPPLPPIVIATLGASDERSLHRETSATAISETNQTSVYLCSSLGGMTVVSKEVGTSVFTSDLV
jgi:hypothetical protein